jgi:hypothetical protein
MAISAVLLLWDFRLSRSPDKKRFSANPVCSCPYMPPPLLFIYFSLPCCFIFSVLQRAPGGEFEGTLLRSNGENANFNRVRIMPCGEFPFESKGNVFLCSKKSMQIQLVCSKIWKNTKF